MVFTVCMVLYDLTLRLVLAAMDGVVAPALCGRPRRNSTGCSTSHKFGRTFVIALVFEQNSGHSPILPWRHDLMDTKNFRGSWSAASNPNSIHSNPFQWVEAISAPSRWHSFALVANGRISQHVTSVSVTQCSDTVYPLCRKYAVCQADEVYYKQFYGAEGIEEGVKHSSASQWHETITSVSHCLVLYI